MRQPFLSFFCKSRGPPRIRMQVCGIRGKRFYKLVVANQRDPRDGKHIEVVGSFAPQTSSGIEEIRIRFSRIKFWLAAGAFLSPSVAKLLSIAQLIPDPPPAFGRRTMAHYDVLSEASKLQKMDRELLLQKFYKNPDPIELYTVEELNQIHKNEEINPEDNKNISKRRKEVEIRRIIN